MIAEKHGATAYLFQATACLASGDFAGAGTSKRISPTCPQAIHFFPTFPLIQIFRPLFLQHHSFTHKSSIFLVSMNGWSNTMIHTFPFFLLLRH